MKLFLTLLISSTIFLSCDKNNQLSEITKNAQLPEVLSETPVNFKFDTPECEELEIIFTGETFADIHIINGDSTLNFNQDQLYTVSCSLKNNRCSSGSLIFAGENSEQVNMWLGEYPAIAKKKGVSIEAQYYVFIMGERAGLSNIE